MSDIEITSYSADIHGDTSYIDAHNTVMNYMHDEFNVGINAIVKGDLAQEENMIGKSKQQQYEEMKEHFKFLKCDVDAIEGNHDNSKDFNEILCSEDSNVKNSQYKFKKIGGKNHLFAYHSDANGFEEDKVEEENYKSIEENKNFLYKHLPETNIMVIHNGIKEFARSKTYHQGLADKIEENNVNVVSGHSHNSDFVKKDHGYNMVSCASINHRNGKDDQKTHFRINVKGKDLIYSVENSELRNWAKEINPNGNYDPGQKGLEDMIVPEEQKRIEKILQNKNKILNDQKIIIEEYKAQGGDINNQKEISDYVQQKHPEHFKEAVEYQQIAAMINSQQKAA